MTNSPQTPAAYQPGVAREDLDLILAHTAAPVWQALRGQRLFISGGTGFVGCWLLEALLWAEQELDLGLHLSVLTRDAAAFRAKAPHLAGHRAVTLLEGSVADLGAFDGHYDSVIHAATDVASPSAGDAADEAAAIALGTAQTLALALRCGTRRYLLTSSGAVYGVQPGALSHIPDDYAGAPPTGGYGQGKLASERLLREHAVLHGLETKSARCFALLGPYLPLDAHFAVGNFIGDGLAGRAIAVNGDGSAYRSYLYAADLAVWLLTILVEGAAGASYNVGAEQAISIAALAAKVAALIPGAGPVAIAAAPAPFDAVPARYVPATDKARGQLRLAELTDLDTALSKTIAWAAQARRATPGPTETPP